MPIYKRMSEEEVFTTPSELCCPITSCLFHDPVITAAGNVYEREAIQRHLSAYGADPITGAPLPSKQLTPVFLLKSRAMEYAETAIHYCLERTTSPGCRDPARWLRRAVDLCDETGFRPITLSESCVKFTLQHRHPQHDTTLLFCFAQGLINIGEKALALVLYSNMLGLEADRRAHAAILKRCIPCWQGLGDDAGESDIRPAAVVAFLQGQQFLDAMTALDILQSLLVPPDVLLKGLLHWQRIASRDFFPLIRPLEDHTSFVGDHPTCNYPWSVNAPIRAVLQVCRMLLLADASTSALGKGLSPLITSRSGAASDAEPPAGGGGGGSLLLAKFIELSEAETARCVRRVETQAQRLQLQVQGLQDKLEAAGARPRQRRRVKVRNAAIVVTVLAPFVPGWLGRAVGAMPVVALWLHR